MSDLHPAVRQAFQQSEPRACPHCYAVEAEPLWLRPLLAGEAYSVEGRTNGVDGWFIVRCARCGLGYLNPAPSAKVLKGLYDEQYFTEGTYPGAAHSGGMADHLCQYEGAGRRRASLRWHSARFRHLLRVYASLGNDPHAGRLLDVGCGAGYFLDAVREADWQTAGVEVSPYAARFAQEELCLAVHEGTLQTAQYADNVFDVVTLFELLEHVSEPQAVLSEVHRVLRPGGLVAVQVPNDLESYRNFVFRRKWWVIPPLHVVYFTAGSLTSMLRESGFKPVYVGAYGSVGTDLLTLYKNRFGRRPPRWLTVLLRRGFVPLDALLNRIRRHSELLVYAVKERD